jgi:endoglucanase
MKQVPLVAGEIGQSGCTHEFIDKVMDWLDAHQGSYLGWTWNTWDCVAGPALISDYGGTPTDLGQGLKDHLTRLAQNPASTPVSTGVSAP